MPALQETGDELLQKNVNTVQSLERDQFITAMRQVANSVAVVTTHGVAGKHGATVSSFCSVSADPCSMLVCLRDESIIAEKVSENGCFCLNVLSQEMEEVADRFAGRYDDTCPDRFERVEHSDRVSGGAHISGSVSFHCQLEAVHLSGSHRIVIGRVDGIEGQVTRPLTYLDGQYRPWLV